MITSYGQGGMGSMGNMFSGLIHMVMEVKTFQIMLNVVNQIDFSSLGGATSGGSPASQVGAVIDRNNALGEQRAFADIADALAELSFTAGGATGPEVEDLRDQVKALSVALATEAANRASADLITAVQGGNQGLALAAAISR